ncbi:MAG: NADH-quinone oxidoreductase subunit NuoF [Burkholderiaceae bacterium]|jgi:NADH-quinone oxidoreductase subunit F|nr:NADH-quinone oxidoreductase subunit NuoF [Burkholderiaceae bacterium]
MTCLHDRHVRPVLFAGLDGDNWHLSGYAARGGYAVLRDILHQKRASADIVAEIAASGLRGRGGAAFPTAVKWGLLPAGESTQKYLVCNADEGEPGTFKDKDILRHNPHALIEGILIAAYTLGVRTAYVYVHGEIWEQYLRLKLAVQEARGAGWVGSESVSLIEIHVLHGFGAYVCGEETALLASMEGKRGLPRFKPPYPVTRGLYSRPTIVNNVETLALIPFILAMGGEAYASLGRGRSKGTKIFSVSGDVNNPGNYEAPLGVPFPELLEQAGGMRDGNALKAVIPGGFSSPILPAKTMMQLDMDYDALAGAGSALGSGGVIVLDETRCLFRAMQNLVGFFYEESCGQCTPCRQGLGWMYRIVNRLEAGDGAPEDMDALAVVASNIPGMTLCALGESAALAVSAFLVHFRAELLSYLALKRTVFPGEVAHA